MHKVRSDISFNQKDFSNKQNLTKIKKKHQTLNFRSFASKNVQNVIQAPTDTEAHTHFHWVDKAAVYFLAFSGTVGMDPKDTATPGMGMELLPLYALSEVVRINTAVLHNLYNKCSRENSTEKL